MTENELAKKVFSLGMKVHKQLGSGLLEKVYEECLYHELKLANIKVERQKICPINYKDIVIDGGFKIDLLVEDKLVIELKSVENLSNLHLAQTLTYLKMTNCKLALLINFNVPLFKTGVRRVINGYLD